MDKVAIIQAYIGPAGSGKTYKALQDLRDYNRQIRIDVQIHGQADIQNGCEVFRNLRDLNRFVKSKKGEPFKACLWPQNIDLELAFEFVCRIAINYKKIAIFADEANRYIGRSASDGQNSVFFQSRHSQTRLFYTMFNPRYVTPEMRGNTLRTYLFKNVEKNFTDYLKERGADGKLLEAYTSDNLPKYSYALIEMGKRPAIVTPEISKTSKPAKTAKSRKVSKKGAK